MVSEQVRLDLLSAARTLIELSLPFLHFLGRFIVLPLPISFIFQDIFFNRLNTTVSGQNSNTY
uniref:Transmembrane protein n=1 Tax=Medicago truncatula TaxID=3880 RepID=A2Q5E5_MEDTR|nr:hypothetical protein MtrDRAFT_AC161399g32v2 [Medicago truncatula]